MDADRARGIETAGNATPTAAPREPWKRPVQVGARHCAVHRRSCSHLHGERRDANGRPPGPRPEQRHRAHPESPGFTRFSSRSVGPSGAQIDPQIGPRDRAHEGAAAPVPRWFRSGQARDSGAYLHRLARAGGSPGGRFAPRVSLSRETSRVRRAERAVALLDESDSAGPLVLYACTSSKAGAGGALGETSPFAREESCLSVSGTCAFRERKRPALASVTTRRDAKASATTRRHVLLSGGAAGSRCGKRSRVSRPSYYHASCSDIWLKFTYDDS